MKSLYYVKWDCILSKGNHKNGYIETKIEEDEVYHYGKAVFAESEDDAVHLATDGWRYVKLVQIRRYEEVERRDL